VFCVGSLKGRSVSPAMAGREDCSSASFCQFHLLLQRTGSQRKQPSSLKSVKSHIAYWSIALGYTCRLSGISRPGLGVLDEF
jgi:hypothetical protein